MLPAEFSAAGIARMCQELSDDRSTHRGNKEPAPPSSSRRMKVTPLENRTTAVKHVPTVQRQRN